MPALASFTKCLYCLWPGLVIGIGWWFSKTIDGKTYYGALPVGIDPLSPQGQPEFETRRNRDGEKRRIIYWCAGIIVAGFLGYFLISTFTIKAKAAEPTSIQATETQAVTVTFQPSETPTETVAITDTPTITPTYAPTATNRIVYQRITVIVQQTVIYTKIVPVEVTREVTPTFTLTPSPTETETITPALTEPPEPGG
jgi:hypothetical protein